MTQNRSSTNGHTEQAPSLVEIYETLQRKIYGTTGTSGPTPNVNPEAKQPDLIRKITSEVRKRPLRYSLGGLATLAILTYALQPRVSGLVAELSGETGGLIVATDTKPNTNNPELVEAKSPEELTFTSLFGDSVELGSLFISTEGGSGQIIYDRRDKTKGIVALPGMLHQHNIEIQARTLLLPEKDGEEGFPAAEPIKVSKTDDGHQIEFNRSNVAIFFDYVMPGAYSSSTDPDSKATKVSFIGEDNRDVFGVNFLAPNSKPVPETDKNVDAAERNRANSLSSAVADGAVTEAKIIALRQTINAVKSAVTNTCYATPTDENPQPTKELIEKRMDSIIQKALDEWGRTTKNNLYLEMKGQYPVDLNNVFIQNARIASMTDDELLKTTARDIAAISSNPHAKYFGATSTKIICTPDEQLSSAKQ